MLAHFHPAVAAWFARAYAAPTRAQELAWPRIASGEHLLLVAPTGSGKTLAAFLALLDRLYREPRDTPGVRVLYVSPLKALNNDIHRNLDEPLQGIARVAREMGIALPEIRTAVRTGDTLANERHRMTRKPPDILITTPESFYLILTSPRAREMLRTVEHVIVDEIHAVAGTKRGSHLALSLERLAHLTGNAFQRIGLSATVRPLDEVARFLGGAAPGRDGAPTTPRPVTILDAGTTKPMDLLVECPVEDFAALGGEETAWDSIEPRLLDLIQEHRNTLLFVNNRRSAERLTRVLNERARAGGGSRAARTAEAVAAGESEAHADARASAGEHSEPDLAEEDLAKAHHGSMSREERLEVESRLKRGELRCVVATGSLELGIDIGSVDLVICVESPRGVARGLQRVGRSGHLVGQTSKGRIVPKFRGDLVESAAVAQGMKEADVEPTRIPRNPLDVLAQQVVAMSAVDEWDEDALFALARRAWPFRDLPRSHFETTLAMLSGKYPAEEFGELRPRIVWDRQNRKVRGRGGTRELATVSGGTIPDRGMYPVVHAARELKLGDLDEEMVMESKAGDVFVLGAQPWRITQITPNRVFVTEAPGTLPTVPFWKGDFFGRTYELGARVGRLLDDVRTRLDDPGVLEWLKAEYALDDNGAVNLLAYVREQAAAAALPGARRIVVEQFRDELGDRRVIVHAPFGRPVLRPWSFALQEALCRDGQCSDVSVTDDGIHLRLPAQDARDATDLVRRVTRANLEEHLMAPVSRSSLFVARFRESAQRALLLPRLGPGRRTPLWLQRLRAADLLEVARKHEDFPLVYETLREILEDWFDLARLREVLGGIETGAIEVAVVETEAPSPFAAGLVLQFAGDFFEEGDRAQQEFREMALSLDRRLLRELLGTSSLRELLEPAAIAEVEARLQRTAAEFRARDRDEVEDLLVRLGDLSDAELQARVEGDAAALVAVLEKEGRAARLPDGRWIGVEDAPLYERARAGGGSEAHADARASPGERSEPARPEAEERKRLVRRYLATHGPVTEAELEARFGFGVGDALAELEREGVAVPGEFTRGRHGIEWVDAHILGQIHRATLAKLRREIEPKAPADYARFLLRWHGLSARDREVADVLEQLQGVWLPVEVWERDVLPARVAGYATSQLDAACASGEFVWLARRSSDVAKPRVAFFRRADLARLAVPPAEAARAEGAAPTAAGAAGTPGETMLSDAAIQVREALARRGASFLADLVAATGLPYLTVLEALWELVFAGLVTNDAFTPLRHVPRPGELDLRPNLTARQKGGAPPGEALPRRPSSRDARREARHRAIREERAGSGRWSLVWAEDAPPTLGEGRAERATESLTEVRREAALRKDEVARAEAWAEVLLARHGIVAYEHTQDEDVPVPWQLLSEILKRWEMRGQARRGFFVEGFSGMQFAHRAAVERLRDATVDPQMRVVAAMDPANPYGASLPAPGEGFARVPGAYLVLEGGAPVMHIEAGGKRLLPVNGLAGQRLASAVATLPVLLRAPAPYRGRRLEVLTFGEEPAANSEAREALASAGFEVSGDAMILWPSRARPATAEPDRDWRQPPVLPQELSSSTVRQGRVDMVKR